MKKICFVNCASTGSTGNLIKDIVLNTNSFSYCFVLGEKISDFQKGNAIFIGASRSKYIWHRLKTFIFGNDGFLGGFVKRRIYRFLNKEKPDIIHIHNVHRSFCDITSFLKYSKNNNVKIVWTLHDEWLLTGRCGSFQKCSSWKLGCGKCHYKNLYPKSLFDYSSYYLRKKRKIIEEYINNIVFVSPSKWLAAEFRSIYKNANVILINNGVDREIFLPKKPDEHLLSLAGNKMIIGFVSFGLTEDKGYSDLLDLSRKIDPKKYIVFALGANINENVHKSSENLVLIRKTSSKKHLSSFYSTVDVFVDLSKGENYPTTHLECLSCGTPIVTYDIGGASETIDEGFNGFVVKENTIEGVMKKIDLLDQLKWSKADISKESQKHDKHYCLEKYYSLYNSLLKKIA